MRTRLLLLPVLSGTLFLIVGVPREVNAQG